MTSTSTAQRAFLIGLAACAMVWAVVRAYVLAITIDEASTYTNFVFAVEPGFWAPHANNHVLNTMLAWIFTRLFGASQLTARSGALIGAAIYIGGSFFLTSLISTVTRQNFLARVAFFVCLYSTLSSSIFWSRLGDTDWHRDSFWLRYASRYRSSATFRSRSPMRPLWASGGASIGRH